MFMISLSIGDLKYIISAQSFHYDTEQLTGSLTVSTFDKFLSVAFQISFVHCDLS